jgi:fatty-acyl-CoA synthase
MFLRLATELAATRTNKVLKRVLRREKFLVDRIADPVYWRPRGAPELRPFTPADLEALRARFERAGNLARLEE